MGRVRNAKEPRPVCPVCGYDQSGLIASWTDACPLRGSCSECGAEIEWCEVLRPELYEQRRYAEHADSQVPRDLFRTMLLAFSPKRLWTWIPRSQPLHIPRLLMIGGCSLPLTCVLIPCIIFVMSIAAMYVLQLQQPYAGIHTGLSWWTHPVTYLANYLAQDFSIEESTSATVLSYHATGVVVASVWALLARHRGVQQRHIVRFAVLMCISLSLIVNYDLTLICLEAIFYEDWHGVYSWIEPILDSEDELFLVVFAFSALWLARGWYLFLKRYLRAQRPLLTTIIYGLIAFLLLPAVVLLVLY